MWGELKAQPLQDGKSITKGDLAMEIATKLEAKMVRASTSILGGVGTHYDDIDSLQTDERRPETCTSSSCSRSAR